MFLKDAFTTRKDATERVHLSDFTPFTAYLLHSKATSPFLYPKHFIRLSQPCLVLSPGNVFFTKLVCT